MKTNISIPWPWPHLLLLIVVLVLPSCVKMNQDSVRDPQDSFETDLDLSGITVKGRNLYLFARVNESDDFAKGYDQFSDLYSQEEENLADLLDLGETTIACVNGQTFRETPFIDNKLQNLSLLSQGAPTEYISDSLSIINSFLIEWIGESSRTLTRYVATFVPRPGNKAETYSFSNGMEDFRGVIIFSKLDGTYLHSYFIDDTWLHHASIYPSDVIPDEVAETQLSISLQPTQTKQINVGWDRGRGLVVMLDGGGGWNILFPAIITSSGSSYSTNYVNIVNPDLNNFVSKTSDKKYQEKGGNYGKDSNSENIDIKISDKVTYKIGAEITNAILDKFQETSQKMVNDPLYQLLSDSLSSLTNLKNLTIELHSEEVYRDSLRLSGHASIKSSYGAQSHQYKTAKISLNAESDNYFAFVEELLHAEQNFGDYKKNTYDDNNTQTAANGDRDFEAKAILGMYYKSMGKKEQTNFESMMGEDNTKYFTVIYEYFKDPSSNDKYQKAINAFSRMGYYGDTKEGPFLTGDGDKNSIDKMNKTFKKFQSIFEH